MIGYKAFHYWFATAEKSHSIAFFLLWQMSLKKQNYLVKYNKNIFCKVCALYKPTLELFEVLVSEHETLISWNAEMREFLEIGRMSEKTEVTY